MMVVHHFFFWNSFCLLHVSFSSCDYCLLPTSGSKLHLYTHTLFSYTSTVGSLPPPSSSFYLFSFELHPSYFSSDRRSLLLEVIHPFHPCLFSPSAFLKFIWTPQLCHLFPPHPNYPWYRTWPMIASPFSVLEVLATSQPKEPSIINALEGNTHPINSAVCNLCLLSSLGQ